MRFTLLLGIASLAMSGCGKSELPRPRARVTPTFAIQMPPSRRIPDVPQPPARPPPANVTICMFSPPLLPASAVLVDLPPDDDAPTALTRRVSAPTSGHRSPIIR